MFSWEPVDLALRMGYRYQPTPVPRADGLLNVLDSDRHVVSFGAGVVLRCMDFLFHHPLLVDFWMQAHFLERGRTDKDELRSPVPDYEFSGYILGGGFNVTFQF